MTWGPIRHYYAGENLERALVELRKGNREGVLKIIWDEIGENYEFHEMPHPLSLRETDRYEIEFETYREYNSRNNNRKKK